MHTTKLYHDTRSTIQHFSFLRGVLSRPCARLMVFLFCSVLRIGGDQVKVFLYEMASIGMRAKTAQRYVEAVSLQYKLQPAARNRLSVRL